MRFNDVPGVLSPTLNSQASLFEMFENVSLKAKVGYGGLALQV
mgnify:CR=1 FL=1